MLPLDSRSNLESNQLRRPLDWPGGQDSVASGSTAPGPTMLGLPLPQPPLEASSLETVYQRTN